MVEFAPELDLTAFVQGSNQDRLGREAILQIQGDGIP